MKKVKIGKNIVPVMDGKTIATFTFGKAGEPDAGTYHFWTAVCIQKRMTDDNGKSPLIWGRAKVGLDAGERFRRMEGVRGYASCWRTLKRVVYVRPSTMKEVRSWLDSHEGDADYLVSIKRL